MYLGQLLRILSPVIPRHTPSTYLKMLSKDFTGLFQAVYKRPRPLEL